jgi:hypothetical protein
MPNEHGVRIGFRIEFRDPGDGGDPGKHRGGGYIEDAWLAAALPRPGDLVASAIVTGYDQPSPLWLPVPFLRVAQVEHYPARPDVAAGTPPGGPGVQVVIHVKTPGSAAARDEAERLFSAQGWTFDWHTPPPGV